MKKKKNSIIIGTIMAVFIFSFATFKLFNSPGINGTKLKGSLDYIGESSITCDSDSLSTNSSTTCYLNIKYSGGTMNIVSGNITANNLTINNVTKTISNGMGQDGTKIGYTNLSTNATNSVRVASISVTAPSSAGTGTISFSGFTSDSDKATQVDVSASTNITITAPANPDDSDATLASLTVSGTNINQSNYGSGATVSNDVTSVTISATPTISGATVTGTGTFNLNTGDNTFTVRVTSRNGNVTKDYTFKVNRAAANLNTNNNIGSIQVLSGNTNLLNQTVSADKQLYTQTVENNISAVTIKATPSVTTSTITINGENVSTKNISLNVGRNDVKIVVTSQSGSPRTYTVQITRKTASGGSTTGLSSVCTLDKLSVTGTNIARNFSPTVYKYDRSVKNNVDSVTISATPTDSKSNVTGTGKKSLKVGSNVFQIVVTAQNGNYKTYVITIVREGNTSSSSKNDTSTITTTGNNKKEDKKDSEVLLKELVINDNKITLSDDNFSYNYTVLYEITSIDIKATTKSDKSKVKITGNDDLKVGKNIVTITVTAEDGSELKYFITVTKKDKNEVLSDDSTLSTLEIKGYDIEFDPTIKKYEVKINKEKQLDLDYITSNENANVVITGNKNLKNGSVVTVEVTAEDGTKSKYEITVKKSGSAKTILLVILGIILVCGAGYIIFIFLKKKKEEKDNQPAEITDFSQADVYDEYIRNTQVPDPNSYNETSIEPEVQEDLIQTFDQTNENTPSPEVQSEEDVVTPVEPDIPMEAGNETVPVEEPVVENQTDLSNNGLENQNNQ